jgi:hypothetical protein
MSGFFPTTPESGEDEGNPDPVMGKFYGDKHPYREDDADASAAPGALPHVPGETPAHDDLPFSWEQLDAAEAADNEG